MNFPLIKFTRAISEEAGAIASHPGFREAYEAKDDIEMGRIIRRVLEMHFISKDGRKSK